MRAREIGLWVLQVAMAGWMLMSGIGKLTGDPLSAATFAAIGAGDWLRYGIGVLEIAGADRAAGPRAVRARRRSLRAAARRRGRDAGVRHRQRGGRAADRAGADAGHRVGAARPGARAGMSTCLWFHGSNSGPAEAGLLAAEAGRQGVDLVPVARGAATDLRGQAVAALDDAPPGPVAVAGWSAGAAIALACAALAPDRVTGAVLVNPAAPEPRDAQQRVIAWACRRAPWLIRRVLAPLMLRTVDVTPAQLDDPRARARRLRFFPAVDRAVFRDLLADPAERVVFGQLAAQAVAAGPAGRRGRPADALGSRLGLRSGRGDGARAPGGRRGRPVPDVHPARRRGAPDAGRAPRLAGRARPGGGGARRSDVTHRVAASHGLEPCLRWPLAV